MPNFKLSRKAKADLKSIAIYTEGKWGRDHRILHKRMLPEGHLL
jgi:plasmid stabilization system protein ParE